MTGQLDVRPFVPDDSTRIEAIRRDALRSAGATYGDALDPVAKIPEYKHSAVSVRVSPDSDRS